MRKNTLRVIQILLLFSLLIGLAAPRELGFSQSASASPILLVVNDAGASKFGRYLGEILRAEGINYFEVMDLSAISGATLALHDLVILAETGLSASQASIFSDYVSVGGRLLAMRPDPQIKGIFGLGNAAGTLSNGYLGINTTAQINGSAPGQGLASQTLQIHGTTDQYNPAGGAVVLAQLYSNATNPTPYPAVISAGFGSGRGAAFTYDLARNVIYTRQGNPVNANLDVDGDGVLRTIDLFQTTGGGAPWVDRNRIPIPQADEQMRLFARLVEILLVDSRPLPRLWYFPQPTRTILVLTGDGHANPTSLYQTEINSINSFGGKLTFYLSIAAEPSDSSVQNWLGQGYGVGIHPYAFKPDTYPPFNITNLSEGYNVYDNWFSTQFSSPKSRTVRNHQVAWVGWTDAAEYAVAHGIALDTDFYHWGPWLRKPDLTWSHGYVTGSGQPMKFIKSDGTILGLYQQLTQLVDEQMILGAGDAFEGLNAAQGTAVSRELIDASQAGYYSALMTQFHVDYFSNGDPRVWAEGTMDYARQLGIPMWNADRWLAFTETRHDANYNDVVWNAASGTLTFSLSANPVSGINLTSMLPVNYQGRTLQTVRVNGAPTSFSVQTIKGVSRAFISLASGTHSYEAVYSAQTATNTPAASPTPTQTATNTPVTSPTPTSIIPATQTPTPTPTPTTPPTGGELVLTSFGDLNPSCVINTNTAVYTEAGGTLRLAGTLLDDFSAASLDSGRWLWGNWSGGGITPDLNSGILSVHAPGGAWVRSQSSYTHGVIEADAEFGNGSFQHIGFASDGFEANRYLIFSTFTGDGNLHARVNNNGSEQRVNLGPIPTGMHRYRVEWAALNATTDRVIFTIDGVDRANLDLPSAGAANYFVYFSNAGDTPVLRIDSVVAPPPYQASGNYLSCGLDAGSGSNWQTIGLDASLPTGTTLGLDTRTSPDAVNWSSWTGVAVSTGSPIPGPGRYVQFRLSLGSNNAQISPAVFEVTLNSSGTTLPTATPTPPPPTATATRTFTPTATSTATPLSSPTATATFTATPLAPTSTSTPTPTATATSAVTDLIFADGFESGNLAAWSSSSTAGGNLRAATAAAAFGSWGLEAVISSNTAMNVTDTRPAAESRYRARFYFDPNSITMTNGNAHYIFYGLQGTSTVVFRVELQRSSNLYQVRASLRNDAGTFSNTAWFTISDASHPLEVDWQASSSATANNGSLTFWIDGVQMAVISGMNNDTLRIDTATLGPVSGVDTGTRGRTYFDQFESRRTTYIGPVTGSPTPTFTPTPTATNTNTPTPTATNTPAGANTPTPTFTPTSTSTPTNTPTPTPTTSAGFPGTAVLDTFNRANGGIGAGWSGMPSGYAITANQLDVGFGGDIFWNGASFGSSQEVFVTLVNIDPGSSEIDLLLKAQSSQTWNNGLIEVWYEPSTQKIQVWTYDNSQGWVQRGADIPVTMVNGDQFGARATATGQVQVYRNGVLLATRDISTWQFASSGGYIGLWMINSGSTLLDQFGGGNSS